LGLLTGCGEMLDMRLGGLSADFRCSCFLYNGDRRLPEKPPAQYFHYVVNQSV
jgi:hypothetical protein